MKKRTPDNPCGVGVPGWPRLMSVPCASAYLSRTTGFVEARLRAGDIPFHVKDADERVIDRILLLPRKRGGPQHEPGRT